MLIISFYLSCTEIVRENRKLEAGLHVLMTSRRGDTIENFASFMRSLSFHYFLFNSI